MNKSLLSSDKMDWCTPDPFFQELDAEFHFSLDPCCTEKSAKCAKFYTKQDDGLSKNWGGQTVFCNPPYGREINKWVRKCYEEAQNGAVCVMLIPARTDTQYFHEYIYHKAEIRFLKGRLRFTDEDGKEKDSAPFPSMVVIFRGENNDN